MIMKRTDIGFPSIKGTLKFAPKEDITTYELAKITQIMVLLCTPNQLQNGEIAAYLEENNLMRHFKRQT